MDENNDDDHDDDDDESKTSTRKEKDKSHEEDDEEKRMRVRAEAVATMRKEEIKRMKQWLESRVVEDSDGDDDDESEHVKCSLIDYIETTEDRCLRKGHTAQDFLRENDEEWGLNESWKQAVR